MITHTKQTHTKTQTHAETHTQPLPPSLSPGARGLVALFHPLRRLPARLSGLVVVEIRVACVVGEGEAQKKESSSTKKRITTRRD